MSNRKACDEIEMAWIDVDSKWTAEVKSKYYSHIYEHLLSEAVNIYRRNEVLESYAENCVKSLRI